MGLWTWTKSKTKKLDLVDIPLIKLSVAGVVLLIAKLWEPILSLDWYWYALIAGLAAIRPMCKALGK